MPTGYTQAAPVVETVEPIAFGMDAASLDAQVAAGVAPDYGTFWVGPWTLTSGWGGPGAEMDSMRAAGVTPAIHFYYWGDDISQSCLSNGCWSSLHNSRKDMDGWYRLADELIAALHEHMGGERVLLFLETEFNKGDLQTHEPLDGYLTDITARLHAGYPAAEVVLSLGNWNRGAWSTWDRAAAASDHVGIQGMRGSTHETSEEYVALYDATLEGARDLHDLFGRPVVLLDIALSSYPEPEYLQLQADALARFFDGLPELREAGVHMLLMRSWYDDSKMNLANYYGEAERHWGLVDPRNGVAKPAADVWVQGVQGERARDAAAPAAPATPPMDRAGGTMDAATFATRTTGVALQDRDALSPAAWALWTNGYVEHAFDLEPGTYDVAVRARGTSFDGQPAMLEASLNGEEVLSVRAAMAYSTVHRAVVVDGPAVLRIAFTNDAMSATEDRNLVLDQVAWTPVAQSPEPVAQAPEDNIHITFGDTPEPVAEVPVDDAPTNVPDAPAPIADTPEDDAPINAAETPAPIAAVQEDDAPIPVADTREPISDAPEDEASLATQVRALAGGRALVVLAVALWAGAFAFFGACTVTLARRHAA